MSLDITCKDSYKHINRIKIREFIKKNLSKRVRRKAKVLCLPGWECIEVKQIYDKIGVKRKNIYAITNDPEEAVEIKRTLPSGNVFNLDIFGNRKKDKDEWSRLFKTNRNYETRFRIVYFDLYGPVTKDRLYHISQFIQMLCVNGGIFGVTFLAARHPKETSDCIDSLQFVKSYSGNVFKIINVNEYQPSEEDKFIRNIQKKVSFFISAVSFLCLICSIVNKTDFKTAMPPLPLTLNNSRRMAVYYYNHTNKSPMITLFFKVAKIPDKYKNEYIETLKKEAGYETFLHYNRDDMITSLKKAHSEAKITFYYDNVRPGKDLFIYGKKGVSIV